MAIITVRSSPPVGYASALTGSPSADFERRWTTWTARGLAHEQVIRQRFIVVVMLAAVALAALVAYSLLSS